MKTLLVMIALVVCGCTIAPAPVHPKIASSWIQTHRIGYDGSGYIVDSEWVRSYKAYYAKFGSTLAIREQVGDLNEGITPADHGLFHVTFETNRRMDHMVEIERSSGP